MVQEWSSGKAQHLVAATLAYFGRRFLAVAARHTLDANALQYLRIAITTEELFPNR